MADETPIRFTKQNSELINRN